MSMLLRLWVLTGGAIATTIMIRIWSPRPVPIMRYLTIFVAGIVGAIVGGYLVQGSSSDPMPGIVAAAAGGLILSGAVAALSTGAGNPG